MYISYDPKNPESLPAGFWEDVKYHEDMMNYRVKLEEYKKLQKRYPELKLTLPSPPSPPKRRLAYDSYSKGYFKTFLIKLRKIKNFVKKQWCDFLKF